MKTNGLTLIRRNKHIVFILLATVFILLLPLIAMQFTDAVAWKPGDFAVAGVLLVGTGLAYQLIARKASNMVYRCALGLALAAALFLIWANLAVGLIGSESEPANLMYIGVLAVGIIGVLIARLQPRGMALALFATALAQALVAGIALLARMDQYPGSSVVEILGVNGGFIVLWIGSALLFQRAVATRSPQNPMQVE